MFSSVKYNIEIRFCQICEALNVCSEFVAKWTIPLKREYNILHVANKRFQFKKKTFKNYMSPKNNVIVTLQGESNFFSLFWRGCKQRIQQQTVILSSRNFHVRINGCVASESFVVKESCQSVSFNFVNN